MKFEIAPDDNIVVYRSEVDTLLLAIAKYMIEPGEDPQAWVEFCLVTDESCIGDMLSQDVEVSALAEDLHLPDLRRSNRIHVVAARLRERRYVQ